MNQHLKNKIRAQLIEHEGIRLKPYRDSVGKLTWGVGWNIEDSELREVEALFRVDNDIEYFHDWLKRNWTWFSPLDEARKMVMVNMVFNLGTKRFLTFKKLIAALKAGDYYAASYEMIHSKWANQVKKRAEVLAEMMLTGCFTPS